MKKILSLILLFSVATAQAVILPVPAPPDVNAKSFVLIDTLTDKVLAERKSEERVEPASLTKIMTVYVAAHELADGNISLKDQITVSEKAWKMEGSRTFLEVRDKVTVDQLLMGIIVQSGNDASVALAEHISGTEDVFASLMNLRAQELGMNGTNFVNATGLPDPEHYTTAKDLAKLTEALIQMFPDMYARYKVKEYEYGGIKQTNRNNLLWRDESVDGVKTGHTDAAGYCLVSSAERNGSRLISVVLGSATKDTRIDASQSLLNYGFRFFETHQLKKAKETLGEARIWMGEKDTVALGIEEDLNVIIPRRQFEHLQATMDITNDLEAPVTAGQTFGSLRVTLNDEEIANVPLIALESVAEAGLVKRLQDKVKRLLK